MEPSPPPESTTTDPSTLFLDMVTASVEESRESATTVSSPHEAYALLAERLELFWRQARRRREPELRRPPCRLLSAP